MHQTGLSEEQIPSRLHILEGDLRTCLKFDGLRKLPHKFLCQ